MTSDLIVILGPTASGKSALSMEVARQLGGEILSCDSMQVYRGMDIGTAKPSVRDQADVRHHAVDVVDPDQEFTVARFVELADEVIGDARARNVSLIITGGTPLYYKALFEGLFDGPGADETIRERLRAENLETLHARLTQVDPVAAERIHLNDRKRLVRALEVFELTGQPISSFQTEWTQPVSRHPAIWFGLSWDRELLNRRINARCRQMIADGWLDESRTLLTKYPVLSKTAAEAMGYQFLFDHLKRNLSLDEATEQIKIATRQLARRQMKWFRRFPNVTWLPGDVSVEQNVQAVASAVATSSG